MGSDAGNSKNGPSVNKSGSNGSGQFNGGSGISGMKCFGYGETAHWLAECKKIAKKKALFTKTDDYDEDELEFEGEAVYD